MSHEQELMDQIGERAEQIDAWDRFGEAEQVTVVVDRRAAKALAIIFELGASKASEVITDAALKGEIDMSAGALAESFVVKELLKHLHANIVSAE